MMVDVDEVMALQTGQAGTGYAIALQNDGGLGLGRLLNIEQHGIRIRQRLVDARDAVAERHFPACLPMLRRIWQQASADPTASPSGRACEVRINFCLLPI